MKSILIIGAGRSASALISYLLEQSKTHSWTIRVGDYNEQFAIDRVGGHANGLAFRFDINNQNQREEEIQRADLVVSMLPATMHGQVAQDCVQFGKHLVTASYVSETMRELHNEAKLKGVLLMNEIGLDPGIDHMSAMQIIEEVRAKGGVMNAFYSYCGGLVAPESNDNPWGYKFSWNPRNVILAGQGIAQFIEKGKYKYLPYQHLFAQSKTISIDGYGTFDAYANRDSLSYRGVYGLESIPTMLRGTLRADGFCKAWDVFVKLGITDDSWKLKNANEFTYAEFIETFLPSGAGSIKQRLAAFSGIEEKSTSMNMIEWTGILNIDKIPLQEASPAQILQELLERKWKLQSGDKDMVVMQHIFEYTINGKSHTHTSSLVVKGDDEVHTAMAKTVGLPAAIAVKMVLTGAFSGSGVVVPVSKELYQPILKELQSHGIIFNEVVN